MVSALNMKVANKVTSIADGDTASVIELELLDNYLLPIPYLDGNSATISLIDESGTIRQEISSDIFDSRVEFGLPGALGSGIYEADVRVTVSGKQYVFPKNQFKLNVTKSANGTYTDIITRDGVEIVAEAVIELLGGDIGSLISDIDALKSHAGDVNNPHKVTKSQVGLGNVQNYGVATQNMAEQGAVNSAYMTPIRVKQAIDSLVPLQEIEDHQSDSTIHVTNSDRTLWTAKETPGGAQAKASEAEQNAKSYADSKVKEHSDNKTNPHGVTKVQVGLGNVDNAKQATKEEFDTHVQDSITHVTQEDRERWDSNSGGGDASSVVIKYPDDAFEFNENVSPATVSVKYIEDFATSVRILVETSDDVMKGDSFMVAKKGISPNSWEFYTYSDDFSELFLLNTSVFIAAGGGSGIRLQENLPTGKIILCSDLYMI